MTLIELIDQYLTNSNGYLKKSLSNDSWWIGNNLEYLKERILIETSFLPNPSWRERIHCIRNGITEIPTCASCNTQLRYHPPTSSYRKYCSQKCSMSSEDTISKIEQSKLDKYGVVNNFLLPEMQRSFREQWLIKYGVDNPSKSEIVKNKIKKSFLKYKDGHPQREPSIQHTRRMKYFMNNNVFHHSQLHTTSKYSNFLTMTEYDKSLEIIKLFELGRLTAICDEYGISTSTAYKLCIAAGINVQRLSVSKFEKELVDYIKEIYHGQVITNDRTTINPLELDIFLPELNVAFECNGLYWHSELNNKSRTYHLDKTKSCQSKGIHLMHVWSNDWEDKPELLKSRIRNSIGLSNKIYARKTVVLELTKKTERSFFEDNHIQGYVGSLICYGLYYDGNLVAAMSFGRPRYAKGIDYELLRYANIRDSSVVGGASKIFSHFIKQKEPLSVISYCDRSFNTGSVYRQLGFIETNTSAPCYWYTKDYKTLYHRVKFQKHKLKTLLATYDESKSEWDNMKENGWDRVWDCGNYVFTWTPDK